MALYKAIVLQQNVHEVVCFVAMVMKLQLAALKYINAEVMPIVLESSHKIN